MELRILTNNEKVREFCINAGCDTVFVEGDAGDVLLFGHDLLFHGWKLAVDPLAGYLSRPNPYHTIILEPHSGMEPLAADILRIETGLIKWRMNTGSTEMTWKLKNDYRELDFSLATNTLEKLFKNPLYFTQG